MEVDLPASVGSSPSDPSGHSIDLPPSIRTIEDCSLPNSIVTESEEQNRLNVLAEGTHEISLPPVVESDSDAASAFDDDLDDTDGVENDVEDISEAPSPAVAALLALPHHFAEYYSVPRVAPRVQRYPSSPPLSLSPPSL